MWKLIKDYEPKGYDHDPLAKKRQTHMEQLVRAADLYDLMYRLQAEEFPMGAVNHRSKTLMSKSNKWLRKIEKFAMNLDLGPEMIRSQPVKQRKLMRVIEKPEEPVVINKETARAVKKPKDKANDEVPPQKLPEKNVKDPNL